ncbi:MarR family transcriptional regulator [Prauserella sp. PE36]|uniref:MarR family transcriptional regulator n=1 Tax=Prauserella endophytica TaxID=1592324 RepID=A0ABY2S546_9PSEU|nr:MULTISPECIES: MarR family transcriptional regulator [Prauserella]RBM23166.1 MarR family transcriptional regulator [Prauserella sp. PE36]TKG69906.1 MarR family transcriptional regulator [Prauserella endophytica]
MSSRPQSQRDPAADRDEERVRAYVENLALTLSQIGFPRMPARVFAALTVSDSGRMNAADLAGTLSVSPAAISGAVRYLEQVGLISKERQPGERRDHYRLYDDFWFASFLKRDRMLRMWLDATLEGVDAVGPETPAGVRLTRMADFLDFIVKEIPALFDRWHRERVRRERDAEG